MCIIDILRDNQSKKKRKPNLFLVINQLHFSFMESHSDWQGLYDMSQGMS